MQDYTKAKYAARRMMQLINRKSEIDPTVSWGMRPVSSSIPHNIIPIDLIVAFL